MIIQKEPTRLFFSFNVNYSTDDGETWTELEANTEKYISEDETTSGVISVTSDSPDANSIDPVEMEFSYKSFDSINIRNGSLLENIDGLFSGANVGSLRIANVPLVSSANELLLSAKVGVFYGMDFPACIDAKECFSKSYIGKVGNINLPYANKINGLFKDSRVGIIGNIDIGEKVIPGNLATSSSLFENAKIEVFPNLNISSNVYSVGADDTTGKWFKDLDSKYMLSQDIKLIGEVDDLHNESYGTEFLSNSQLKFAGINVVEGQMGSIYNFTTDDTNATLFSKISQFKGVKEENVPLAFNDKVYGSKDKLEDEYGAYSYLIEDDKWMNGLTIVETYVMPDYDTALYGLLDDSSPIKLLKNKESWRGIDFYETDMADRLEDIKWKYLRSRRPYFSLEISKMLSCEPSGYAYTLLNDGVGVIVPYVDGIFLTSKTVTIENSGLTSAHFLENDSNVTTILCTISKYTSNIYKYVYGTIDATAIESVTMANCPDGFIPLEVYQPHADRPSLVIVLLQNPTSNETYACTFKSFEELSDYNNYTSKTDFSGDNRPTFLTRAMGEPNEILLSNRTNGFTYRAVIGPLTSS